MNLSQAQLIRKKQTKSLRVGVFSALITVALYVYASYPLNGLLSGQGMGFDICEPDFLPENIYINFDLVCSQEEGGSSFQCVGTATDTADNDTAAFQMIGTNSEGYLSGTWTFVSPPDPNDPEDIPDNGNGSFSGSFDGAIASIFFQGSSLECSNIEINADLNFSELSGDRINVGELTDAAAGTSSATLSRTVTGQVNTIGSRASGALKGGGRRGTSVNPNSTGFNMNGAYGLNAGDGINSLAGVWFNYTYSDFDDDFAATAFDAKRHSFLGGVDFNPWTPVLIGVAFGYETADFDTDFNGGSQDTDGWTISPYLAASLSDNFSVDVVFGYSDMDTDQFRTAGATRITSDFGADRYFFGGNINGFQEWGNWFFTGTVGWIWAREYQDDFTESNGNTVAERKIKLGNWRISGEAAYSLGDWEPYASATYGRDYQFTEIQVAGAGNQPANDRDDVLLGLGLRYYSAMGISGSLEWSKRVGRKNFDEDSINFLMRMDF